MEIYYGCLKSTGADGYIVLSVDNMSLFWQKWLELPRYIIMHCTPYLLILVKLEPSCYVSPVLVPFFLLLGYPVMQSNLPSNLVMPFLLYFNNSFILDLRRFSSAKQKHVEHYQLIPKVWFMERIPVGCSYSSNLEKDKKSL